MQGLFSTPTQPLSDAPNPEIPHLSTLQRLRAVPSRSHPFSSPPASSSALVAKPGDLAYSSVFYASSTVLLTNTAFLLYGALTHGGIHSGIATLIHGDLKTVSRMSTALHVFINILSTILLTSSNYAMQILCAPTRGEIEDAHRNGRSLEIGLTSVRNLRHTARRRVVLWWLLAASSVPLHLLSVDMEAEVVLSVELIIKTVTTRRFSR